VNLPVNLLNSVAVSRPTTLDGPPRRFSPDGPIGPPNWEAETAKYASVILLDWSHIGLDLDGLDLDWSALSGSKTKPN
jgi:hypothetical protein